jgi:MreB/Mrl family cell shape determining protein
VANLSRQGKIYRESRQRRGYINMVWSADMGIDLGTATVLVYLKGKGIVLNESSVVAIDQKSKKVLAVGENARNMLGRTPGNIVATRPLREGVIADFDATEIMLKHFIMQVCKRRSLFRPRVVVCIPAGTTSIEKKAVIEAITRTGAKEAYLIEEPRAAALGAGLDIFEPSGSMVVDIGGGTTDMAVLSMGETVTSCSVKVGGDKFDEAIIRYIKKEHNLFIGERSAESLKIEIGMEEYLVGVVAAEMPSSFHMEALKAQAVIARTYALQKRKETGGNGCKNHPGSDLCTDSACCQAWEDVGISLAKWPTDEAPSYLQRIQEAVRATHNMIVTYEGEPIEAVYHSTCGGVTEAAAEAWSGNNSLFYLQSVECSYCRHSPYFKKEIVMESSAYAAALKNQKGALPVLGEGNIPLLEVRKCSSSGRNLLLSVGNSEQIYSGTEVRSLLGLPSTFFRWHTENGRIIFTTRGHGHGVGLCQYGADGMGREGKNYQEILKYYYQGVEISRRQEAGGRDQKTGEKN